MEENDLLLGIFAKKTSSKTVYVESPTSLLGALRTRNISPVTVYRGYLEISSQLKIKVNRMLRAGGYFAWAAQPVYKHELALEEQWERGVYCNLAEALEQQLLLKA